MDYTHRSNMIEIQTKDTLMYQFINYVTELLIMGFLLLLYFCNDAVNTLVYLLAKEGLLS